MTDPTTYGPYRTEQETCDSPLVRDVRNITPGLGAQTPFIREALIGACLDADVTLGEYDRRILDWLTNYEPQTAQVLIGIISRAYAAGVKAGEQA